jgi:putative effector of murein hydrolase LrgA (UPF0299 family)
MGLLLSAWEGCYSKYLFTPEEHNVVVAVLGKQHKLQQQQQYITVVYIYSTYPILVHTNLLAFDCAVNHVGTAMQYSDH